MNSQIIDKPVQRPFLTLLFVVDPFVLFYLNLLISGEVENLL